MIAINLTLTLLSIAYPLLLWGQPDFVGLPYLPFGLGVLWLVKAIQAVGFQRIFAIFMTALLLFAGFGRELNIMLWYPVAINLFMLTMFGGSLWTKQSIIEKLARLQDPNLPADAVAYTRKVTQVWCAVFLLNIVLTLWFIWQNDLENWALYTGVIAYFIMALVMVGEWLIRQKRKKKNGTEHSRS